MIIGCFGQKMKSAFRLINTCSTQSSSVSSLKTSAVQIHKVLSAALQPVCHPELFSSSNLLFLFLSTLFILLSMLPDSFHSKCLQLSISAPLTPTVTDLHTPSVWGSQNPAVQKPRVYSEGLNTWLTGFSMQVCSLCEGRLSVLRPPHHHRWSHHRHGSDQRSHRECKSCLETDCSQKQHKPEAKTQHLL